tara:strand:- start:1253 stop:1516 length:264 start_codon:yes stop_codon:yes gene_type:complete
MTRKKREEMNTEELRNALVQDCKSVLSEIDKLIEKGLETAPDVLLRQGDAFIILYGALTALETGYLEAQERKRNEGTAGITDKKNYN